MEKLLLGVMKFRNLVQPSILPSLKKLANKAQVRKHFLLILSCRNQQNLDGIGLDKPPVFL